MSFWSNLFFPKECLGCQQIGDKLLCSQCLPNLSVIIPHCIYCQGTTPQGATHTHCQSVHTPIKQNIILYKYKEPIKSVIRKLKYGYNYGIAHELRLILKTGICSYQLDYLQQWNNVILLPVPLHKTKKRQRGFNQSLLIGKALQFICQDLSVAMSINSGLVCRKKFTKPQAQANFSERSVNVAQAFSLSLRGENMKDNEKHLYLIIDDVISSGSTVNEMACILNTKVQNIATFALARG